MNTETSDSTVTAQAPGALSALKPQPYWGNERVTCLIPCATDRWQRMTEDAREMDRMAVREHGQMDRDHHLCAMQRQQFREGFVLACIETNIYGFAVRDTLNDGAGVLLRAYGGSRGGDGSAGRAIEFARRWHAEDPTRRAVILGYVAKDMRSEWETAIAKVTNDKETIMATEEPISQMDTPALFRLATGEVIRIVLCEGGLGTEGYRLKIYADKGLLTVLPSAGNSIELTTIHALEREQEAIREVVVQRNVARQRK